MKTQFLRLKRPRRRRCAANLLEVYDEDRNFIEKFRNAARRDRYERSIEEFKPKRRERRVVRSVRSDESCAEDSREQQKCIETQWIGLGCDLKPYVPHRRKSVLSMLLELRLKRNKSLLPPAADAAQKLPHISSLDFALDMSAKLASRFSLPPPAPVKESVPKQRKRSPARPIVRLRNARSHRSDLSDAKLSGWDVEEGGSWNGLI